MYQQKFKTSERRRRRKAMVFTILFHVILLGGLTFGTSLGSTVKDAVKDWFQADEKPAPATKAALVKS